MILGLLALIAVFFYSSGSAAQPFPLPIDDARVRVESSVSDSVRRKQAVAVLKDMETSRDAVLALIKKDGEQTSNLLVSRATTAQQLRTVHADLAKAIEVHAIAMKKQRFALRATMTKEEWSQVFPVPAGTNVINNK